MKRRRVGRERKQKDNKNYWRAFVLHSNYERLNKTTSRLVLKKLESTLGKHCKLNFEYLRKARKEFCLTFKSTVFIQVETVKKNQFIFSVIGVPYFVQ